MDMFSAYCDKNLSYDKDVMFNISSVAPALKTLKKGRLQKIEMLFEKQTWVAHNLGKLLRLKTKQIERYEHVLDFESNLYYHYQML